MKPPRRRALRVYAGSIDGEEELVIASPSERAAIRRLRISAREFRRRFRETQVEDYEVAKDRPGEVLHRPLWSAEGDPFTPLDLEKED